MAAVRGGGETDDPPMTDLNRCDGDDERRIDAAAAGMRTRIVVIATRVIIAGGVYAYVIVPGFVLFSILRRLGERPYPIHFSRTRTRDKYLRGRVTVSFLRSEVRQSRTMRFGMYDSICILIKSFFHPADQGGAFVT